MDVINSFFSNIKDKLTNPFFGTLILVLLIHHWELWFAVFNFGENYTLPQKVEFIENYINNNFTFYSFLWDIGQALLYMLLGYLIIVGTRSLVLMIEYNLMPAITGKVVNKNVVRKTEYDEVVKEREEYFDQYEEQRENVRKFSKTIDEQTEQIKSKDRDILEQSESISKTVKELETTERFLEKTKRTLVETKSELEQKTKLLSQLEKDYNVKLEKIDKYQNLFFGTQNEKFFDAIEKFPPEVISKYSELIKENKWKSFLGLANFYENGGTIGGDLMQDMIKRGFAFEKGSHENLTPVGRILWQYRHVFDKGNIYKIS